MPCRWLESTSMSRNVQRGKSRSQKWRNIHIVSIWQRWKWNFPVGQVHKSYTKFDITRTSISLISWKFLLPESVWEAMDSWCSLLERCQLPVSSQKSNPGYTRGNMQHFCKVSIWKKNICREKTWQNCTLVPHPVPTTIEHCACKPTEIWFDNLVLINVLC